MITCRFSANPLGVASGAGDSRDIIIGFREHRFLLNTIMCRGANHIHTVWRDFDGDFGRDLLKEHYSAGHAHLIRRGDG